MYACGLRIMEAATLPVTAIDRGRMVLRIIGKGNKERLVPLPQPVLAELERLWYRHRNRTVSLWRGPPGLLGRDVDKVTPVQALVFAPVLGTVRWAKFMC